MCLSNISTAYRPRGTCTWTSSNSAIAFPAFSKSPLACSDSTNCSAAVSSGSTSSAVAPTAGTCSRISVRISSSGSAVPSSPPTSITASFFFCPSTFAAVISVSGSSNAVSSSTLKWRCVPSTAASPQFHPRYESFVSASCWPRCVAQCASTAALSCALNPLKVWTRPPLARSLSWYACGILIH